MPAETKVAVGQTDHLQHWSAIADHMEIKQDAARHLARTVGPPMVKIGKTVAASRAAIDAWLADMERKANPAPAAADAAS